MNFPGTSDPFTFDFQPADDLDDNQRWSTYRDVEKLCRGPEPVPDWVVTESAAIDTELGILKTGKEADVFLIERTIPDAKSSILAAKRYRGEEHRLFHRSANYTATRSMRNTRDNRAVAKKTSHGRAVAAGQWAWAEWESLKRLWTAGVPVPYPVQIDGTEILMEFIEVDGVAAPRLAQARPDTALLSAYFEQLRDAMALLAQDGIAHGDLSPFNILAAGDRLVIIDLPQVVDLVANPLGADFLMRDCTNVCSWFQRRGLEVDEHDLFAELLALAY
jgi:RIO kinase 1